MKGKHDLSVYCAYNVTCLCVLWYVMQLIRFDFPFNAQDWLACNFSLQYPPWIEYKGHENKGNDHKFKKLLIVKQILPVNTIGNVKRTVLRMWILILGWKELQSCISYHLNVCIFVIHLLLTLYFYPDMLLKKRSISSTGSCWMREGRLTDWNRNLYVFNCKKKSY